MLNSVLQAYLVCADEGARVEFKIAGRAVGICVTTATPRNAYEGTGDSRKVIGRLQDLEGRPLSAMAMIVHAQPFGALSVSVLAPDSALQGVESGHVIGLEGDLRGKVSGGDFGSTRTTISGVDGVVHLTDFEQLVGDLS